MVKMIENSHRREHGSYESQQNYRFYDPISEKEIKETLRKMANGKAVGPNQIPVEAWKALEEGGLSGLQSYLMLS